MNPAAQDWLRASRELIARLDRYKNRFRSKAPGQYPNATVYRVRRTRIHAHWRRAHVAVRLKEELR